MSKIDQAFVKAFAKERPRTSASQPTPVADDLAALGMSSFWIDPSNHDFMRVDEPQAEAIRPPASGRRRGDRPTPPPRSVPPTPASAGPAETSQDHSVELLRIDTPQSQPAAEHLCRTRLDASSFPAITVSHDAFEDAAVAEGPATTARVRPPVTSQPAPPAAMPAAVPASMPAAMPAMPASPAPVASSPAPIAGSKPFEAAWEVDEFETPAIINELLTNGGMIAGAGVPLAEAARAGLQRVLITSPRRGAGRSTLALGLALAAATTGLRVALVDGDWTHPSLVDDLHLELEFGWPEAIRGGVALSETAVHSVGDGVTLLPIVPTASNLPAQTEELHRTVDQLAEHFDLILVDGPSTDEPLPRDCFQSGIIVRDLRSFDKAALDAGIEALRYAGVAQIGIAENFAD